MNVPLDECSVRPMFCSTNVPFDQCSIRPMFLRRKCFRRKCFRRKYPNPIMVTVFLSILNQMEFQLVQNRKENRHHYHIPFNLKRNRNIVFAVIRRTKVRVLWQWLPKPKKKSHQKILLLNALHGILLETPENVCILLSPKFGERIMTLQFSFLVRLMNMNILHVPRW